MSQPHALCRRIGSEALPMAFDNTWTVIPVPVLCPCVRSDWSTQGVAASPIEADLVSFSLIWESLGARN